MHSIGYDHVIMSVRRLRLAACPIYQLDSHIERLDVSTVSYDSFTAMHSSFSPLVRPIDLSV